MAEQRYLAELGVLTSQPAPATGRAADRAGRPARARSTPDPSGVGAMMADTATLPWLRRGLGRGAGRRARRRRRRPRAPADAGPAAAAGLAEIAEAVAGARRLRRAPWSATRTRVLAGYDAAIARAASAEWRGDPAGFDAAAADLRATARPAARPGDPAGPGRRHLQPGLQRRPAGADRAATTCPSPSTCGWSCRTRGNVGLTTDDIGVTTLQPSVRGRRCRCPPTCGSPAASRSPRG